MDRNPMKTRAWSAFAVVCVGLLGAAGCQSTGGSSSGDGAAVTPATTPASAQPATPATPSADAPPSAQTPVVPPTGSVPTPVPSSTGGGGSTTPPSPTPPPTVSNYPLHQNITTTFFWAGESADGDNGGISNVPSAWDDEWAINYGGVDDPKNRNGYQPGKFVPKENPFYFALPYNDFNSSGNRKPDAKSVIYWGTEKTFAADESMCKNRWIRIDKNGKSAYAQWEDVGPFLETDSAYVFGTAQPKNKQLSAAGLDISPAVRDYLSLQDVDKTSWQFIDEQDVPAGPWKDIITKSQINWK